MYQSCDITQNKLPHLAYIRLVPCTSSTPRSTKTIRDSSIGSTVEIMVVNETLRKVGVVERHDSHVINQVTVLGKAKTKKHDKSHCGLMEFSIARLEGIATMH